MKKLLVIIIMVLLMFSFSDAQKINRGFASTVDTLQAADSLYFAHTSIIAEYGGVVSFSFTMTNSVDSCNNVIMQGSDNNSNWSIVSILADTDVIYGRLTDVNPNYLYYRLFMSTAAGDTVIVTSVNFTYKEE